MKQTAVEWLVEQIKNNVHNTIEEFELRVEQAKSMEKEQIIDAHKDGFYSPPFRKSRRGEAEQYYNETYGKDE